MTDFLEWLGCFWMLVLAAIVCAGLIALATQIVMMLEG